MWTRLNCLNSKELKGESENEIKKKRPNWIKFQAEYKSDDVLNTVSVLCIQKFSNFARYVINK